MKPFIMYHKIISPIYSKAPTQTFSFDTIQVYFLPLLANPLPTHTHSFTLHEDFFTAQENRH